MRVVLTSTNGNLGSRVLKSILDLKLIDPFNLVISTSSPQKVDPIIQELQIPVITGDYTKPQELSTAFCRAKADILFLVSYPSPAIESRITNHKSVIDAARRSGAVKLIVYTSLMFGGKTGMQSTAGLQQAHIATVNYLASSGLEYVVLREGIYAESWWLYSGWLPMTISKSETGPIKFIMPNDGAFVWVTWDDLGEGTARILARLAKGERQWIGKTLNLTGPRASTLADVARLVTRYSGRKVEFQAVGKERALKYHLEKKSSEEWYLESWAGWFEGIAAGECEVVDPFLEEILGRPPRGIEEVAEQLFTPQ